jgi:hypothetical protein
VEPVQGKIQQLTVFSSLLLCAIAAAACINPFAPRLNTSPAESTCDPHSIEGVFLCFQNAYTFRDTTSYGQLLDQNFIFTYRDYDRGIDVTWGRVEEMRTTYGLFENSQKIDLVWNAIVSTNADSNQFNVVRGFTLTIVFNPSDIEHVDGYANLTFHRAQITDPWKIVQWRDESNY